jgi:glycosyltransferase involved in cell wall biosynthesis
VTGRGGGPEKTILNSPRYIGDGYEMRLGYLRPRNDPDYDLPERAAAAGVTLVDIPESGAADLGAVRRVSREIREFQPHLIHAHDYKTNLLSVLLGKWHRVPAVTTVHGYVTRTAKLNRYYAIDRWSLKRMQHVIAVSEDIFAQVRRMGVRADRCSLIHNAIDSDTFRPRQAKHDAKERLMLPSDRLVVGAVGRLSAEKGFDILIRAADRLLDEGVPLQLLIVGEGPARTELERQISKCRHSEQIRLLGHCRDVMTIYEAMDAFVLSSLREGLPNALLEAMAMQTPVVATRIAGVPRVIADGESGLLVPPGNEQTLVDAMRRLLTDERLRERMGAAGRKRMVEQFSFRRRMDNIRAIYDEVLDGSAQ